MNYRVVISKFPRNLKLVAARYTCTSRRVWHYKRGIKSARFTIPPINRANKRIRRFNSSDLSRICHRNCGRRVHGRRAVKCTRRLADRFIMEYRVIGTTNSPLTSPDPFYVSRAWPTAMNLAELLSFPLIPPPHLSRSLRLSYTLPPLSKGWCVTRWREKVFIFIPFSRESRDGLRVQGEAETSSTRFAGRTSPSRTSVTKPDGMNPCWNTGSFVGIVQSTATAHV